MMVNLERLKEVAVPESKEELAISADRRDNGDMYKASFRIAMKIRRALRVSKMTQAQLSEKMDVDPAIICRYLSGKANMELKTMVKIEKALGINIIDREISPKKTKMIILYGAFEDKEDHIHNSGVQYDKLCDTQKMNETDIWQYTTKLKPDFISFDKKTQSCGTKKKEVEFNSDIA